MLLELLVGHSPAYQRPVCPQSDDAAIALPHRRVVARRQLSRAARNRFEAPAKIVRRRGNRTQHLALGGLLLQGLCQVGCALLEFLEESGVLDSDGSLVS